MKARPGTVTALIVGIVGMLPPLLSPAAYGSALFSGSPGSYAASDGQLAGGQTLSEWTIELWAKRLNAGVWEGLFNNTPVEPWKEIAIRGDQTATGILVTWPDSYYSVATTPGAILPDEWQLLSFVGDAASLRVYVDGVELGSAPSPGQASFASIHSPNTVGAFSFGLADFLTLPDSGFYNGYLADFRVWDRALPADELLSHVSAQPAIDALGLLNWIPFNETSGDVFHDIVGGLEGRYYNVTLTGDGPTFAVPESGHYGLVATGTIGVLFLLDKRRRARGCHHPRSITSPTAGPVGPTHFSDRTT